MKILQKTAFLFCAAILLFSAAARAQMDMRDPRVTSLLMSSTEQEMPAEAPPLEEAVEECAPAPFGQSLFDGGDEKSMRALGSPKQRVVPGDRVSLAVWGAVEEEDTAIVDSQGFIYVKGVGPIKVAGLAEDELGNHIRHEIGRMFKDDVRVYARLEQGAGTPVLVTGGVGRPGQYYGSADDSVIVWLQRAGGIAPGQGSYRNLRILREGETLQTVDLYPFLQNGIISGFTFSPGDVIVVGEPWMRVTATGGVNRCAMFELPEGMTGGTLADFAQPRPGTTHAMIQGFRDKAPTTRVVSIEMLRTTVLEDGDTVRFYTAPHNTSISLHVEGPTKGNRILAVPQKTMLSEALDHIPVDPEVSDVSSVYIKRAEVAKMQQKAMEESAHRLLQSALTVPAASDGEALIRAKEAELIGRFVQVVKGVKAEGRVVVMHDGVLRDLPLEEGDTIVIPQKTNVVSIEGEVVLPRTVVVEPGATAREYVEMAGGYTERALKTDFILIRPNGDAVRGGDPEIRSGDRLLVLPKVDTKHMQFAKDIVQILYQVAIGAGVLLEIRE